MIKFLKWLLALMEKPETAKEPEQAIPGLTETLSKEIQQCPFCKFDNVACVDTSYQGGKGFIMMCYQCGTAVVYNPDLPRSEVIKRYNKRPVENQLRRDIEFLLKD